VPKNWSMCWRCDTIFTEKASWKKWPQGPTCLTCRDTLELSKKIAVGYYEDAPNKTVWNQKVKQWEAGLTPAKQPAHQGMKKGELRRIPASSSPVWTDQWVYQGSGKMPYVVSHKKNAAGSSLEWQCSCPAWTTTTPREDCKHVLKVKLTEGIPLLAKTNGSVYTGHVNLAKTKPEPAKVSTVLPVKTGRKFR
jgi:hypothetical protein